MAGIRTLTPTPPQTELRLMERLADLERRLDDAQRHGSVYVPTGAIIATGANTADSGFLLCNGAAYSREVYNVLYSRIGTIWGAGNGSTTFNVPNLNNGTFLRAAAAAGAFGGSASHSHSNNTNATSEQVAVAAGSGSFAVKDHFHSFTTNVVNHLPPYADVVFQIKV